MPSKKQKSNRKIQANSRQSSSTRGNYGYNQTGSYHHADQKRDVWEVAGYPAIVDFDKHWNMQARFGIAKAGIHRIVDKCWQSSPVITDGEYDGKRPLTSFEKDLEVLVNKHDFLQRMKGGDWRDRIGRYSGILPIVRETNTTSPDQEPSKSLGIESLLKLVPLLESQLSVENVTTNSDISSENYGMPGYYNLRQDATGDRNPLDNSDIKLHTDRVFIFAEGADDGSIFGKPALESGFNALLDLEKICAASAEGHFKNAKQRTILNVKDSQVANTLMNDSIKAEEWKKTASDFASGFDNMLTLYGMDAHQLQSTLSDPTAPFTNALNIFAASLTPSIPASELIGVQMNKQASVGNATALNEAAESRRVNNLNPNIKGLLMYFVGRGIMSAPINEILIDWPSLSEPTFGDKVANMKTLAETVDTLVKAGGGTTFGINVESRIMKELDIDDIATAADVKAAAELAALIRGDNDDDIKDLDED